MNHTAKEILIKTIQKIEEAYAPATIRAYKANFEVFIRYCDENNVTALPAQPETISQFIRKISDGHLKSSSIKIALASIAAIHSLNALHNPTQHPDVKIEMRRMYRTLGRYAKQAYGINKDLLDKMILSTDRSLQGLRDKAILLVAYDSLCRRSELVALEYIDILITDGNIKLKLRKSKTDPLATGRWLYLSKNTQHTLREWLNASSVKSGRLFRGLSANGKIKDSLNSAQIGRIYKKLARKSGVDAVTVKNISGHSTRVGAAQDLLLSGATLPIIMNRGRWSKIDTIMKYLELTNIYN
jgi:site-specific recombinase XerD